MITPAQAQALIVQNLNDIRCSSVAIFIQAILKRNTFGPGVPEFRIRNKVTGNLITSLADFISAIDANHLAFVNMRSSNRDLNMIRPFTVVLKNLEIKLMSIEEDNFISIDFGSNISSISLDLSYLNDNDPVLPLKIVNARLF